MVLEAVCILVDMFLISLNMENSEILVVQFTYECRIF
jgi:hypothetical protein